MIKVLYFARLREQLGIASEELVHSTKSQSLASIMVLLNSRGGAWADVFNGDQPLMMAINQEVVSADAKVVDGDEVAFFPPVTGG